MRSKTMLIGVIGVVIGVLLSTAVVLAGSLNPTVGPTGADSQMYTLQQIYDRLATGAATPKMTEFTEPSSGPGTGTMRTLDEIMTKAPALDATNGAVVADVASGKTFWGLTSGAWGVITGTASGGSTYSAGVPKTGQTKCYNASGTEIACAGAGQDGDLQKGVTWPIPRFITGTTGVVTDTLTGLIWLKSANCFGKQTWANALTSANALNSDECGLTDGSVEGNWRLPNRFEIESLIHYGFVSPAVPNTMGTAQWVAGDPFTGVQSSIYWTSTTNNDYPVDVWTVNLINGNAIGNGKSGTNYVWPVRGGQ